MKNSNNYYKVTQLDVDLWAIEDIKSSENSISYLLCGQNKAMVFDTGLGLGPVLPLIQKITELPLVAYLSHWHFDHSGGAHEFDRVIGWKSENMQLASQKGVAVETIKAQVGSAFWKSLKFKSLQTKSFPKIQLIEQEQKIDLGGYRLKLLHTPGHTKDSICIYEPNKKWLFSGDTVYPGPIYLQFDDSDAEDYKDTIQKLLSLDITTIFPGHNSIQVSGTLLNEIDTALADSLYASKEFSELSIVL